MQPTVVMILLYLKALHIIFIVTWFAGLFYIVRLFVYHCEAIENPSEKSSVLLEQYRIMERRLWYGITWPSAVITLFLGTSLLFSSPHLLTLGFMQIKLGILALLYAYHMSCHFAYKQLQQGTFGFNSMHMRWWNEVATLFLFCIVFVIVIRDAVFGLAGALGLLIVILVLSIGIITYKRLRRSQRNSN